MSRAEIAQCVGDIGNWFEKKTTVEIQGAAVADLERLSKSLDMELPEAFEELYQRADGDIWVYEYRMLAVAQISKLAADVNEGRSKLLPFARDLNDGLLF